MHFTQDQILQELHRQAQSAGPFGPLRQKAWRATVRTGRCLGGVALAVLAFILFEFGSSLADAPLRAQTFGGLAAGLICWAGSILLLLPAWFWAFGRGPSVQEQMERDRQNAICRLAARRVGRSLRERVPALAARWPSIGSKPQRRKVPQPSARAPARPRRFAGAYASIEYALAATNFVHSPATGCSVGMVLLRPRSRLAPDAGLSPQGPRRSALKTGFKEARMLQKFLRRHPSAVGSGHGKTRGRRTGFAFFL